MSILTFKTREIIANELLGGSRQHKIWPTHGFELATGPSFIQIRGVLAEISRFTCFAMALKKKLRNV